MNLISLSSDRRLDGSGILRIMRMPPPPPQRLGADIPDCLASSGGRFLKDLLASHSQMQPQGPRCHRVHSTPHPLAVD